MEKYNPQLIKPILAHKYQLLKKIHLQATFV
jgi:hypothetical protein